MSACGGGSARGERIGRAHLERIAGAAANGLEARGCRERIRRHRRRTAASAAGAGDGLGAGSVRAARARFVLPTWIWSPTCSLHLLTRAPLTIVPGSLPRSISVMSSGPATSITACMREASSSSTRKMALRVLADLDDVLRHGLAALESVTLVERERQNSFCHPSISCMCPGCYAPIEPCLEKPGTRSVQSFQRSNIFDRLEHLRHERRAWPDQRGARSARANLDRRVVGTEATGVQADHRRTRSRSHRACRRRPLRPGPAPQKTMQTRQKPIAIATIH